jgi:hypothetical protein
MALQLAARCREEWWVRIAVATLRRFEQLVAPAGNLEALLEEVGGDPAEADRSMRRFEELAPGRTDVEIAGQVFGAKVWYRLNGMAVTWRPPAGKVAWRTASVTHPGDRAHQEARRLLLCMIGSGLDARELLALRAGDLGSLDAEGRLIGDLDAEPLAVRYQPLLEDGRRADFDRITFLSFVARAQVLEALRQAAGGGPIEPDLPLWDSSVHSQGHERVIEIARTQHSLLIGSCNEVNVTMCRATGDFFRAWGMPGQAFEERQGGEVPVWYKENEVRS